MIGRSHSVRAHDFGVDHMCSKTIWLFVKFFTEEKYADQFLKGELYLNRLSYFKKIEREDDGRVDTNEAVATWWQPDDLVMTLNAPGIGEIRITSKDLAAPVSMSFVYHDHVHVFCLYAMHTSSLESLDPQRDLAEHEGELQKQLQIDERCLKFGPYAVVIQAVPFIDRLKEALRRKGMAARLALVQYYDDETFHGEIPPKDVPFRKQKRFNYQQEYRLCVYTNREGDNPLTIDIGDLSQICTKVDSPQLNEFRIQLSLPTAPSEALGE
jgi:hypothetical protein